MLIKSESYNTDGKLLCMRRHLFWQRTCYVLAFVSLWANAFFYSYFAGHGMH